MVEVVRPRPFAPRAHTKQNDKTNKNKGFEGGEPQAQTGKLTGVLLDGDLGGGRGEPPKIQFILLKLISHMGNLQKEWGI